MWSSRKPFPPLGLLLLLAVHDLKLYCNKRSTKTAVLDGPLYFGWKVSIVM